MKKLLHHPKTRLGLLLAVMGVLLVLNLLAPPPQLAESAQANPSLPTTNNTRQTAANFYGAQAPRARWEPTGTDMFVEAAATQPDMPVQPQEPLQPPEPPVAPPAMEPVAPPLPYVAMARFKRGDKSILYLSSGTTMIPVSEGDLLGNGDYKIESISDAVVSIRYLPMNHLHELSLSGLE